MAGAAMIFIPAPPVSLAAFVAILVAVAAAAVVSVKVATTRATAVRFALAFAAWLAALSGLVASGLVEAQPLPFAALFFAGSNLAALAFALSPLGARLAAGVPLAALIAFQAFRFPLELVLHQWAATGTIPGTMTWTGQNLDVVSGILALAVAPFAARARAAAWAATLIGLALLLNVMRVALLSSPLPFAWQVEPPLQLAFHLPYALIVPVCVAGALAGHVITLRQLLATPPSERPT